MDFFARFWWVFALFGVFAGVATVASARRFVREGADPDPVDTAIRMTRPMFWAGSALLMFGLAWTAPPLVYVGLTIQCAAEVSRFSLRRRSASDRDRP
ncbi:hypothetical protein ABT246_27535 [Streptomyces sp. NPDC001553]|uniref:hypothetical protein n=1 Tax=Streptomyces sp. NPDC001553 TaxID=3154385 RepID=UPI00331949C5